MVGTQKKTDGSQQRIPLKDENAILAAASALYTVSPEDNGSSARRKERTALRMELFRAETATAASAGRTNEPKRLRYDTIDGFLNAAGMSYSAMLNACCGTELTWAQPVEKQMCSVCDALNQEQRDVIYALIMRILPQAMKETLFSGTPSGLRMLEASEQRKNSHGENWAWMCEDMTLYNLYTFRNNPDRIPGALPFGLYAKCIPHFDVSPHWLLFAGEKGKPVLAKNTGTELIMDAFCLLPDPWKPVIKAAAAEQLAKKRGKSARKEV